MGWGLVALSAVLRLRAYLVDRSLWRDEAALTYNLLHRGALGFNRPLDFQQGTPPGFFVVEKAVIAVAGSSEEALRLVPLLAGIAAIAVAFVLARRHLEPIVGLVALALCAVSPALTYYSGEVKQYSTDVLLALLVMLAASTAYRRDFTTRSCLVLAGTGVVAVVCSHASTFTLAGVGIVLAVPLLRRRRWPEVRRLVAVGATWAAALVVVYALFDRGLDDNPFLRSFWSDAFLPLPPHDLEGVHRWGWALSTLFSMLTGNQVLVVLFAPLAVVGIVRFARHDRGLLGVLLMPWAFVVVASAVHLYPAADRLVLFLLPSVAVLVGGGVATVVDLLEPRLPALAVPVAVIVCVLGASVAIHWFVSPSPVEEVRPLLERVRDAQRPGDALYATEVAVPAVDYYAPRLGLHLSPTVAGKAQLNDPAALDAEIAPLLGHDRVWVVSTQFDQPWIPGEVTREFARHGRLVQQWQSSGASVYLYDLSSSG